MSLEMDERKQLKEWLDKVPVKTLWAISMVREFIDQKLWGEITIKFQDGSPELVYKSQTFKRKDLE